MEREISLPNDEPDIIQFNYDSIYSPIEMAEHGNQVDQLITEGVNSQGVDLHQSNESMTNISNQSLSLEHFTELLKCFICFKRVKDAVICPFCSKFACEPCLKKWVVERRSECPACRRALGLGQIIKCRFLTDISNALHSFYIQQIKNYSIYENNEGIDRCQEHSLKMTYFCVTCARVICSDCVMFTKVHENHKFERIKDMFERTLESINKEMNRLKRKINDHESYLATLYKHSESLKKSKEEKVKDLLVLYRALNTKLDSELNGRVQRLEDEKRRVEEDLEYLETIYTELTNQLKNSTPAKTIAKRAEYLQSLAEINSKKFTTGIPVNLVTDFGSSITLKFAVGIFTLKPYSGYRHSNDPVFSDPLVSDGITWRIKVYPNGTGAYKNLYLSVFVEMVKGWEHGGSFCYRITLLKPERENENIEREYISEFENSICWGYNRFCKIEDIENQGFWDREKDQITLKFQIRPANHLQRIKDQGNYIEFLEAALEKQKSKNRKFKQELSRKKQISLLSKPGFSSSQIQRKNSNTDLQQSAKLRMRLSSQSENPAEDNSEKAGSQIAESRVRSPGLNFFTNQEKKHENETESIQNSDDSAEHSHEEHSFVSRGSTDKQDCTVDGDEANQII